jgi:DNA polymerase-3 subunit alpha
VIRYVQQRYGRDQVAQIITFGTLQARGVLRDVGRVLQMPYGQVDRLCKLVPQNPANPVTLAKAIEERAEAAEGGARRSRRGDAARHRAEARRPLPPRLDARRRHRHRRPAAVELVPMYRDPRSDMPVTQFNMKWVEQAGLVKFDFLGLKTLTVLMSR